VKDMSEEATEEYSDDDDIEENDEGENIMDYYFNEVNVIFIHKDSKDESTTDKPDKSILVYDVIEAEPDVRVSG
jgi:hypothetical protein